MQKIAFLLPLLLFQLPGRAQYTPILNEDFNDNARNWPVGRTKNSVVEVNSGHYYVMASLLDKEPQRILAPFTLNPNKAIRIEANITDCFNYNLNGDLAGGILFAAKDEKNGFGFIRSFSQSFKLLKFIKGKPEMISIFKAAPNEKNFDLRVQLEDWQWLFFVNGELVYMCDPMPWMGDKAGIFVEKGSYTTLQKLMISEGEKKGCPYKPEFSDEELRTVLESVYCEAKNNFDKFVTVPFVDQGNDRIWFQSSDMMLKGQISSYVFADPGAHRHGRAVIFELPCPNPRDKELATIQFEILKQKLERVHRNTLCGPSQEQEGDPNTLSASKPRQIFWKKSFSSDRFPKVITLGTSLYIHKNGNDYQQAIFIYMATEFD